MTASTINLVDPHGPVWRRYSATETDLADRLAEEAGLDRLTIETLTAMETRPRCIPHEGGAVVILRGINLNPGANPEDMVSVRIWVDDKQVVTVQVRQVRSLDEVQAKIGMGAGPKTTGDLVVVLAETLAEHMQSTMEDLETSLDELEDELAEKPTAGLRSKTTRLRRQLVTFRRFIAPQRDALGLLFAEDFSWQTDVQDRRLRNTIDTISRIVEQLDEMHSRAAILQEGLTGYVTERTNRTIAILSLIAGIFLPLSFVASLLGMNVAGIPGATSQFAFGATVAILVAVGVLELVLFRWLKML